ncbi:MAG: hypothetical protein ACFB4I_03825 [Cyanophyceae cyanobacterium]
MSQTNLPTRKEKSASSDYTNVYGSQNLKQVEKIYQTNKNSNYTERIEELQKQYNYDDNCEYNWLDPEFSLLYGSRLYESASETQKKALNHLYWICFYNYSIGGEIATMMFNQLTCGAFYHLGGYETLCHELDLETAQERVHVEAFRHIGQLTERALLGKQIFNRPIPDYLDAALVHPQKQFKLNFGRKLIGMFVGSGISRSPFLASQYYVLRGLRNNQLKVKEYRHSLYSRELAKQKEFVAAPTLVSHYHCLDEAFHTSTSKLVSHEMYKDFAKPTALELLSVNLLVRNLQFTMSTLSGAVPGIFSDDAAYMPLVYEMLRSPLFALSAEEALQMVEDSFCREHDGFHVAAKYHQRALKQNLEYVEGIEHLSGVNRELKVMASASVSKSLQNNIETFHNFVNRYSKITVSKPCCIFRAYF